jgi:hypothetical protein
LRGIPVERAARVRRSRRWPDYLLDQFATVLKVERDMLYFLAQRTPPDIRPDEASESEITAAYRAFRRELKSRGGGKGGKKS